jgi:hypothetical protein
MNASDPNAASPTKKNNTSITIDCLHPVVPRQVPDVVAGAMGALVNAEVNAHRQLLLAHFPLGLIT